jgi:hypothetical protein
METQNLWKKNLGVVPDEVWEQTRVRVLILAGNGLSAISPKIANLQNLRTLDLGHNRLESVPGELGDITELSDFLYLHDNQLDSLPASLRRLQKIRYLNISTNRFTAFPECICSMSQLLELRVTDNQLTCLPRCIGNLSKLRELHLRNNALRTLPAEIANLSELRLIDLRGNPIEELPDGLSSLPKLEKLDLRWVNSLKLPAWFEALENRGCLIYR